MKNYKDRGRLPGATIGGNCQLQEGNRQEFWRVLKLCFNRVCDNTIL